MVYYGITMSRKCRFFFLPNYEKIVMLVHINVIQPAKLHRTNIDSASNYTALDFDAACVVVEAKRTRLP